MAKCSICNRRWFFSSKVKCNCKAEQLKVRAAVLPSTRSVQHTNYNNDTDIALLAMHQQNFYQIQQQHLHSNASEGCRTGIPSSEYRTFDSSHSHCYPSHDSSSSSSNESSSSCDSGSSSSSSWD